MIFTLCESRGRRPSLKNPIKKRWTGEIPAGPDNYQYKIKRGDKLNSQTMNSDTSTINNTN
jgi:hypothetical protein